MIDTYSVPLTSLVKEFSLEVAFAASDYDSIRLTVEDVARPGLQLAGFFDHFEPLRLQVMGNVEMSYMAKLPASQRQQIYDRLFSYKFPALIIARGIEPSHGKKAQRNRSAVRRGHQFLGFFRPHPPPGSPGSPDYPPRRSDGDLR